MGAHAAAEFAPVYPAPLGVHFFMVALDEGKSASAYARALGIFEHGDFIVPRLVVLFVIMAGRIGGVRSRFGRVARDAGNSALHRCRISPDRAGRNAPGLLHLIPSSTPCKHLPILNHRRSRHERGLPNSRPCRRARASSIARPSQEAGGHWRSLEGVVRRGDTRSGPSC